jgi:G3E family GTPase
LGLSLFSWHAELDESGQWVQAAGRRVDIMDRGHWGERTPQSRIVAIGSLFDPQDLRRTFDACLAQSLSNQ